MNPESQLSTEVLELAVWSGREIGWRAADIGRALADARDRQLAVAGGQVQFVLPDGTWELYWQNYEATGREAGEPWLDYVSRSHEEVRLMLDHLPAPEELAADGIATFPLLGEKVARGLRLEDYLVYVCHFESEPAPGASGHHRPS